MDGTTLCPSGHMSWITWKKQLLLFCGLVVNTSGEVPPGGTSLATCPVSVLPNGGVFGVAATLCKKTFCFRRVRNVEPRNRNDALLASFSEFLFWFVPQLDVSRELSDGLKVFFLNPSNSETFPGWRTASSYWDWVQPNLLLVPRYHSSGLLDYLSARFHDDELISQLGGVWPLESHTVMQGCSPGSGNNMVIVSFRVLFPSTDYQNILSISALYNLQFKK